MFRFELTQTTEARRLLQHLSETPDDFIHHIRK